MKTIKIYIAVFLGSILLGSCELSKIDNYDGPNATISGGIYDVETGELVQQDIVRGVQIEYIEDGFDNPQIQYMIVKNDGTYQNKLMFEGTYTITPVRGNFIPIGERVAMITGDTKIDFEVKPYIRVKNAKIEKLGSKVIATFNIEQTVPNKVNKIGLFVHQEPNVGDPLNVVSSQSIVDGVANEDTVYTLEIDLAENSSKLKSGEQYFFRVGALIDAPEAKFNYAAAIRLGI